MTKRNQKSTRRKVFLIVTTIIVIVLSIAVLSPKKSSVTESKKPNPTIYFINLLSGSSYPVGTPKDLVFDIRDDKNHVLNQFADDQEQILQILVIRKDRTNYQHLHPVYDKSSGKFVFRQLTFTQDGSYRLFVLFDENGDKDTDKDKSFTLYRDIAVGDAATQVDTVPRETMSSSVDGFDTSFFFPPGDDSPGSIPDKKFYSGQISAIAISIDKDQKPVTDLTDYKGSVARIVAIGPSLEVVTANSTPLEQPNKQSGLATFELNFPTSGLYKLYMQIDSGSKISTFEYTINVLPSITR